METITVPGPDGRDRQYVILECSACHLHGALQSCTSCGTTICSDCTYAHACPQDAPDGSLRASLERMVAQYREASTIGSQAWQGAQAGAARRCELAD